MLDQPRTALGLGFAVAAAVLIIGLVTAGADAFGIFSFLLRFLHVLAAMVWVGLIFFVNFIQLVALKAGDEQTRGVLHTTIVPHVAWWFRHASTITVITGLGLLLTAGYALPTLIYGTGVYVPPARAALMWFGVLGALAMWMFVHMYIWPAMQVVLGLRPGDANVIAQARARVAMFARLNLVIVVPVTLVMVAAAHLY